LLAITSAAIASQLDVIDHCNMDLHDIHKPYSPCPNRFLCVGCKNEDLFFAVWVIALCVTLFFGFAAFALFSVHFVNYIRGKTTNERFARA